MMRDHVFRPTPRERPLCVLLRSQIFETCFNFVSPPPTQSAFGALTSPRWGRWFEGMRFAPAHRGHPNRLGASQRARPRRSLLASSGGLGSCISADVVAPAISKPKAVA